MKREHHELMKKLSRQHSMKFRIPQEKSFEAGYKAGFQMRLSDAELPPGEPCRFSVKWIEGNTLEDIMREVIRQALVLCGGDIGLAAKSVGISRCTLYRRVLEYFPRGALKEFRSKKK